METGCRTARKLLLRGPGRVGPGVEWRRGVGGMGGERGGGTTNSECGMTNGGPEWRFQAGFGPLEDGWGRIHDAISTLMSIASLSAAPRVFLAAAFRWAVAG